MFGIKQKRIAQLELQVIKLRLEIDNWEETARHFSVGLEYYRNQLDLIAEHFGEDAYICDDGSLSQDPLRAKMVDLVSQLVREKDLYQRVNNAMVLTIKILIEKVSKRSKPQE